MTTLALYKRRAEQLEEEEDLLPRLEAAAQAKDAEAARLKPELDKALNETFDRLSKERGWPSNDSFRKQILARVAWFFLRNPFLNDMQQKLAKAEHAPALKKRRGDCSRCTRLCFFIDDSPFIPCAVHSALTPEQHAQFEFKMRKDWAEHSMMQAEEGLRSTLKNRAQLEAEHQKWLEAEAAKQQRVDIERKAECRAKQIIYPKLRCCKDCKEAKVTELNELCGHHQTELEKIAAPSLELPKLQSIEHIG